MVCRILYIYRINVCIYIALVKYNYSSGGFQALEDAEEVRRQAIAKAAHQREQDLADERERRDKLARADARNREEERTRKAEEHRLQVRPCAVITHGYLSANPLSIFSVDQK